MQDSPLPARRTHSAAFKAKVLAACALPGTSVVSVALAHGINANLVHRWRRAAVDRPRTQRRKTELGELRGQFT